MFLAQTKGAEIQKQLWSPMEEMLFHIKECLKLAWGYLSES